MTEAERYAAARAWFERLVSAPPERLAAELDAIPDPTLRSQVRALLDADADPRPVEPLRSPPPDQIGRFRVVRELGRGGMGVVYEAEEHAPRRRVALKLLHPWLRSPALDDLARREAQALADAPHPGIPSVFALFDDAHGPVVIMELVEGVPFAEGLRHASRRERLTCLARVADAIAYAHARGVVHRDLKPQNLILTPAGQPKVLDFGLADTRSAAAVPGGGTPAYVAPEQARGEAPSPAADQFSLGVLAWETLAGALPDEPGGRPLRDDDAAVLRRAMHPDPARRYPGVEGLAAELRRLADDRPVAALPGWRPRLRSLARRHPRLPWLAVAALALALASPRLPQVWADVRASAALRDLREPLARGDATAVTHLEGLLHDPGLVATPAVAEGWRLLAARAPTPAARLEALAAAWTQGGTADPGLTAELADALRGADLDVAAAGIESPDDPLRRWDLAGAAAAAGGRLGPVLAALAAASPADPALVDARLDPDGGWQGEGAGVVAADGRRWALPGAPADVVRVRGGDGRVVTVVALRHEGAGLYTVDAAVTPWAPGAVHQRLPVRRVDAADLDGDGADEVVVAATGWSAHELRVYTAAGAVRTRLRFAPWDVAITRDRTVWVLGGRKPDRAAPRGERRTLLPLRLEGDTLVPGPPVRLDRPAIDLLAADLDGDGADELVLCRGDSFGVAAGDAVAWVPGLQVRRRVQGDADAATELLVEGGGRRWILGAGGGALPLRPAAALARVEPPPELRGRLRSAWTRTVALARLEAGEPVLPRLLELVRASRRPVELRLAALDAVLADPDLGHPSPAAFATELVALAPDVPLDAATSARVRATHPFDAGQAQALPEVTDSLVFTAPLPAWLELGRPGTVHRDPLGGVLALDAGGDDGVLLRVGIRPEGGPLCVDLPLTVTEADWSAGLVLALGDGEREVSTTLWRTGGGPPAGHQLTLSGPGVRAGSAVDRIQGAHEVSMCLSDAPALASARLDGAARRLSAVGVPALTGPLTLELRGPGGAGADPSRRFRAELLAVRLRGGHLERTPGRALAAHTAYAESGTGATDARGRALEAGVAGHADRVDWASLSDADVVWLLRHDAARWAGPAARALGDRFPARFAEAWDTPAHYGDAWAIAALRAPGLPTLPADTPPLALLGLRRAQGHLEARELAEARAVLDALPPHTPEVVATRARLALRSGRPEEVPTLLRRALADSPAPEAVRDVFADDPELSTLVADVPAAAVLVP